MQEFESRVGADFEHDAGVLRLQVQRRDRRKPQDAPPQPGPADRILACDFLTPVLVGWRDRSVDTQRRLAILDIAEDPLRRREHQPLGRR
jgi:hypothetical protein